MVPRRQIIASVGSAMAVWAIVLSASAQTASPYTMPDPTPAGPQDGASRSGSVVAPPHANDEISQDEITVPPPPPMDNNPLRQMVKGKKSWIEMTPEEILGIAPDKKSTDVKSPGLNARDSDHSPLHDFLQEERLRQGGKDNSDNAGESGADDNFWRQGARSADQQRVATMPTDTTPGSLFSRLLDNSRNGISHQFSESKWDAGFITPPPPPPTANQLADMAAFREMLNPPDQAEQRKNDSFGDKTAVAPGDPDVAPVPAKYNPDGGSYTTVDDGIGRPKKLDALPTATTGLSGYQTPYAAPAWAPKPPPWTLSTPQLFVEPQRHF